MNAPLISFDDASGHIAAVAKRIGSETVPIASAAGRVLTAPVRARLTFPRHATAMRDGYAVIRADVQDDRAFTLVGEKHAGGGVGGQVVSGQAMRIFTGAAMPAGADCVIMQEYAEAGDGTVRFRTGHGPAHHVRAAGSDFAEGATLLDTGMRLSARALVTAAAADVATVEVARSPRVAIIGTGDELAEPGFAHARPTAIPDSVTHGVAAMAIEAGAVVVSRGIAPDDLRRLEEMAGDALSRADVIIVTGGASVGDRDFGRGMFASRGLDLVFAGVAMMPGRPVWLGRVGERLILGLPGNPSSAMVTARLFLIPLLAGLLGQSAPLPLVWRSLPLARPIGPAGAREAFLRAQWQDEGLIPAGNQDSGMQAVLAMSDWLIRRPAGAPAASAGELVTAIPF